MHGSIKKQFFFFPLKKRNRLVLFLILTFISHSYPKKTCLKAQNWRFFIFFYFPPSPIYLQLLEILFPLVLRKWGWCTSIFHWGVFFFFLPSYLIEEGHEDEMKVDEQKKEEEIFKKLSIVHHLGYFFIFISFSRHPPLNCLSLDNLKTAITRTRNLCFFPRFFNLTMAYNVS